MALRLRKFHEVIKRGIIRLGREEPVPQIGIIHSGIEEQRIVPATQCDLFPVVRTFLSGIQKPRNRVAFIRGRLKEFQPGETEHLVFGFDAAVQTLSSFPVQGQQCEHDAGEQEI